MKRSILSMFLALVICCGAAAPIKADAAVSAPTEQQVFQAIIAMKEQYPEGMRWTNDNYYGWKGGIFSGGYGCAGFSFLLSDAAFGNLPARKVTGVTISDVRVGDILRINNDGHSVIVLEVHDSSVVVAEGNYNNSIHWGRTLSTATVQSATYMLTRYPEIIPAASFSDVPHWCADAVSWAAYKKVTTGTGDNKFSPDTLCTNGMILTFLWRAAGEPTPDYLSPIPMSGNEFYATAVHWAFTRGMIGGDFNPNAYCTRLTALTYIWQAVTGGIYLTGPSPFSDLAAIAPENMSPVLWAVENGITNGYGDNTFRPDNTCSRGEIVTFLHRAYVPEARQK